MLQEHLIPPTMDMSLYVENGFLFLRWLKSPLGWLGILTGK